MLVRQALLLWPRPSSPVRAKQTECTWAGRHTGRRSVNVPCQPFDVVAAALALASAFEELQSFNSLNGDPLSWRPSNDRL